MKMKIRATVGSLLVTAVAAGAAVMPAASQAAQPGDLCWTHWWMPVAHLQVLNWPGGDSMYALAPGGAFRVLGYGHQHTYYGHGNGKPNGYLVDRDAIDQATCTQ